MNERMPITDDQPSVVREALILLARWIEEQVTRFDALGDDWTAQDHRHFEAFLDQLARRLATIRRKADDGQEVTR